MSYSFLTDFPRPLLFAHRGRSALAPENTHAAFSLAWESGIPGIELDIRLCRSGELVVFHDDDLERITGKTGAIEDMDISTIKEFDAGSRHSEGFANERIPTLREVFEAAPDNVYFDIEIKPHQRNSSDIASRLQPILLDFKMNGRCIISSFYPSAVRAAKAKCAGHPTAFIYSTSHADEHKFKHTAARLLSDAPILKPQWQKTIQILEGGGPQARKPLLPWTINDASVAKRSNACR